MADRAMSEMTGRELVQQWWNDAWKEGLWAAAWSKSIDDLAPAQAAWSPAPGRHNIWQIVLHMIFWRESWLRRAATGQKPSKEELATGNFPDLRDTSATAWTDTRRRFADTQSRIAEALNNLSATHDPIAYFLPHDCYHFGQVNYLRAMQGLKAIE